MQTIHVNTPETLKRYRADCAVDRKRERMAEKVATGKVFPAEHDREFVGKVIYIPPQ